MAQFKTEESVFNFAVEYLKGISNSLKMCEQSAALGSMDGWISWLRIAYRQLGAKTSKAEDNDFNKDFREINKLINNRLERITKKSYIFYLLDNLELKIRKELQKKGMLLPGKEDPRFAVLKR
jgi:hypothetical protein